MLDPKKLLGQRLPEHVFSWSEKDVVLYALGLGVGDLGIGPRELRRLYERDLEPLPTFATLGAQPDVDVVPALRGAGFDPAAVLHASHRLVLHRAVPPMASRGVREGSVVGVHDKGAHALVVLETTTTVDDEPLATCLNTIFVRGEGGFGESHGQPPAEACPPPERAADASVEFEVRPNLASLYRWSGDLNPLHIDPELAGSAGLPRPILHGMCSLGIAATAAVDAVRDGATSSVAQLSARFSGMAFPGDLLTVLTRRTPAGAMFEVVAASRDGAPVLSGGSVTLRPEEH